MISCKLEKYESCLASIKIFCKYAKKNNLGFLLHLEELVKLVS